MLTINALSHHYDTRPVLQDVSLHVAEGELVCLVGSSGAGKSTLLRLIAGLQPVQKGEIRVSDIVLSSPTHHTPPHLRHVGMVFQHPTLFPHLTVAQNIRFGLHHQSKSMQHARVNHLLDMIEMTEHGNHYPHQLSGGQQQRVAIARALAPSPHIMLLDEPFANLDSALRASLRHALATLLATNRVPTILVTHDLEEARSLTAHIFQLQQDGTLLRLF
jgi:iron(III) transport system ATP-binding protein